MLDTNILIYLEESDSPFHQLVVSNLSKCTDEDVLAVSVLSFYELEYGITSRTKELKPQQALADFQKGFQIFPVSLSAAKHYAQFKTQYRTEYQSQHNPPPAHAPKKHDMDFLIAATALEQNAILISGDTIFEKLQVINPDLKLGNWVR